MASASPRPPHQRNKSSRSGFMRALVTKTDSVAAQDHSSFRQGMTRTQTVPLLPADYPHGSKSEILGERPSNVQSPPASPSKRKHGVTGKTTNKGEGLDKVPLKKSKSSTALTNMFSEMNRSSKDMSAFAPPPTKDKENSTPPASSHGSSNPPIWAQFSSTSTTSSNSGQARPVLIDNRSARGVHDEITKYTPQNYSPSKQRNFNGSLEEPILRPTISRRPQSVAVVPGESVVDVVGRRVSGTRVGLNAHKSHDSSRSISLQHGGRLPPDNRKPAVISDTDRKVSGSSAEQAAPTAALTVAKRIGAGRVMAAVAALQIKTKRAPVKEDAPQDPADLDAAFEAVLDARNIPPAMREKMRSLTMRVKADFIRQDQGAAGTATSSPVESAAPMATEQVPPDVQAEDESRASKRSRPRSRTFTFTRRDKSTAREDSPSKKTHSQSKSRPNSVQIPKELAAAILSTSSIPSGSKRGHTTTPPVEYITYLKKNQDPVKIEVGRLHKLRILLRNETVAWVDSFVAQGGMAEVVALLHRTMAVEWREEHEDQLLHETLLCLKGLCTTERAMAELVQVAEDLFPALLAMLFDDEKKGPAEYSTRTIIINVLFNYLNASLDKSPAALEQRARKILAYLGEPSKPVDARPVDFVLGMHVPRPYKLWCREVSNTTKEVFWIFLHQLNVVPLPTIPRNGGPDTTSSATGGIETEDVTAKIPQSTYTQRHFPGLRPPVPAAPYIGGVEWDATTYITAHLDLLNGLIASLPTASARNTLRAECQSSGLEKTLGGTLRTCKEKFYSGVHDGLRVWVAAAAEDGWETNYVRQGPTMDEQVSRARSASPKKNQGKKQAPPQLGVLSMEVPKLEIGGGGLGMAGNDNDDGWLG